jgi:hypothetical protein
MDCKCKLKQALSQPVRSFTSVYIVLSFTSSMFVHLSGDIFGILAIFFTIGHIIQVSTAIFFTRHTELNSIRAKNLRLTTLLLG